MRAPETVPPHIYRMLEWYLMVRDKFPSLSHQYYERRAQVGAVTVSSRERQQFREELQHQFAPEIENIRKDLESVRLQLTHQQKWVRIWMALFVLVTVVAISNFLFMKIRPV